MSSMVDIGTVAGAAYGLLQALGQLAMLFPKNTKVFKFGKYVCAGPSRQE